MKIIYWYKTDIPELFYTYIAGIRCEKLITQKGHKFCIGEMEKAKITFSDERGIYKYLTI